MTTTTRPIAARPLTGPEAVAEVTGAGALRLRCDVCACLWRVRDDGSRVVADDRQMPGPCCAGADR